MGVPTLLTPGSLRGHAGMAPIDYIVTYVKKMLPQFGGAPPTSFASRVLIVKSETGSGKSTVLPAALFRILRSKNTPLNEKYRGRSVVCTQPRVLTAITLARDLDASPHYPDLKMRKPPSSGHARWFPTLGFTTGAASDNPKRGLTYATAGVLRAQLQSMSDAEFMSMYAVIVVDEVHELSIDTNLLLWLLKRFLIRNMGNPNLPVVVLASATIDVEKFARYFDMQNVAGAENCLYVSGRQFPIKVHWPETGTNDFIAAAADRVMEIHNAGQRDPPAQRDILVFMPGLQEMRKLATEITKRISHISKSSKEKLVILLINRDAVRKETPSFRKLKGPLPEGPGARRVVISTVVAETGLTIETLKYVIEPGWSRDMETYFPQAYTGLVTRPAPKSRIKQRWGRCGRLFPGEVFPLYTEKVFNELPRQQLADVVTKPCGELLLAISENCDGVLDTTKMDLLDSPPVDALASGLEELVVLGFASPNAIEGRRFGLTKMGKIAARFPRLPLAQIRLLLAAQVWGVAMSDAATLCAVITMRLPVHQYFVAAKARNEKKAREQAQRLTRTALPFYLRREDPTAVLDLMQDNLIEVLLLLEAFTASITSKDEARRWCEGEGVDFDQLVGLIGSREAVLAECARAGLDPFDNYRKRLVNAEAPEWCERVRSIKMCLHDAYRLQYVKNGKDRWGTKVGDCGSLAGRYALAPCMSLKPVFGKLQWKLSAGGLVSSMDTGIAETSVGDDPAMLAPRKVSP